MPDLGLLYNLVLFIIAINYLFYTYLDLKDSSVTQQDS